MEFCRPVNAKTDPDRISELSFETTALQTFSPLIYKSYANDIQDYLTKQKTQSAAEHQAPAASTTPVGDLARHLHDHVGAALLLDDLSGKAKALESGVSLMYKNYANNIWTYLAGQKNVEGARMSRELECATKFQSYSKLDFEYQKLYGRHLQQDLKEIGADAAKTR